MVLEIFSTRVNLHLSTNLLIKSSFFKDNIRVTLFGGNFRREDSNGDLIFCLVYPKPDNKGLDNSRGSRISGLSTFSRGGRVVHRLLFSIFFASGMNLFIFLGMVDIKIR